MKYIFALLLLVSAIPLSGQGSDWDAVEIKTTHIAGKVYMLEGREGNIGVYAGSNGVFLVDDQFAPLTQRIVAAVRDISPKPIEFVVNTHLHGDHVGGNENLAAMGVKVVAHDLVRDRLKNRTVNRQTGEMGPGVPAGGLPTITFQERLSFHYDDEEIRVIKMPAAHTDGDSIVHFTKSNVIHMGDVYRTTTYPFVDVNHGGTFHGTLRALAIAAELADDDTVIIPGHGKPSNKKELLAWRKMLITIARRIQQSVDTGDQLEEALARNPGMEFNDRWGADSGIVTTRGFMALLYNEISGQ